MSDQPTSATRRKEATTASRLVPFLVIAFAIRALGCANAKVGDTGAVADGSSPPLGNGGNSSAAGGNTTSTGGGGTSLPHPPTDAINTQPAMGSCDPTTNAGCPSGQKCTAMQQADGSFAMGCGGIGSKREGDSCTQGATDDVQTSDDCASGLACFMITGDATPVCRHMCNAQAAISGCTSSQACEVAVPGLTDVRFCRATTTTPSPDAGTPPSQTCQPLEQRGCAAGQSCYFSASGPLCWKNGSKKPGETCVTPTDCMPGSSCVTTASGATCAAFCSTAVGGTPGCSGAKTGGSTCVAFGSAKAPPNLGYCGQ